MRGELSAALASVNHLLQLKYYSHEVAALRSRIAEEMGHTHAVRRITRHTTQSRHTRQRLVGEGQGAFEETPDTVSSPDSPTRDCSRYWAGVTPLALSWLMPTALTVHTLRSKR
jgi:hypothetical protein